MKVVTSVTLVSLDKDGKAVYTPPGTVDVDDDTGKNLIARGQAKTLEKAKKEKAAQESGPNVTQTNAKPDEDEDKK